MASETEALLDDVGWRILCLLQENARQTYVEIGKEVGLTSRAVAERVRRMEEAGIITGYRAEVDASRVGLPLTAFIRIATAGEGKYDQVLAMLRERPEVLECHRVTGTDSFFIKAIVASVQHLEEFLVRLVPYGQPTTSVVLSSPVTHRVICRETLAQAAILPPWKR
ncbi:MAG: Lrp/AsnC family transcriptional regulator [Chloroflexota bacterium]